MVRQGCSVTSRKSSRSPGAYETIVYRKGAVVLDMLARGYKEEVFLRMLRDVLRFNRESLELLSLGDEKVSLGDYLCGAGYSSEFVDHHLVRQVVGDIA